MAELELTLAHPPHRTMYMPTMYSHHGNASRPLLGVNFAQIDALRAQ
eukprot:COSAG01_NODE_1922_length_8898_cov_24.642459_8_plen_47_part_00